MRLYQKTHRPCLPLIKPAEANAGLGFIGNKQPENDVFFYHPDHLGSTSYITSKSGEVSQHVEYIAFGEILFEEHSSSVQMPYLFNGKELDRETNLSYFGARYLDMKTSLWLNVDPLWEKYKSVSPYVYCMQTPINAIDPDGKVVIFINGQHTGDGGKSDYWNGLDQRIANRFGDQKGRYYDGAMGGLFKNTLVNLMSDGWKNNMVSGYRKNAGSKMGYSQAAEIYANLKDGETIKIATHSMGGAYGKGFEEGLRKYAKEHKIAPRIERVLDLATFQGDSLNSPKDGVLREQIAHTNDGVAGVSRIQGIKDEYFHETRKDKDTGMKAEHSVDSFTKDEINKFVKPGNTSQKSENNHINVKFEESR